MEAGLPLVCQTPSCIISGIGQTRTHNGRCRVCGGACVNLDEKVA